MKLDKENLIVIIVCAILIGVWAYFAPHRHAQEEEVQEETATVQQPVQQPSVLPQTNTKTVPVVLPEKKLKIIPRAFTLENENIAYCFDSAGILNEITLKSTKRTKENAKPITITGLPGLEPLNVQIPGCTLQTVSAKKDKNGTLTVLRKISSGSAQPFFMTQTYVILPKSIVLESTISFDSKAVLLLPQVVVWAGALAPLKQMSGEKVMRDVHQIEYSISGSHKVIVGDPSAKLEKFMKNKTAQSLEWVAVSNKYFLSMLTSGTPFSGGCDLVCNKAQSEDEEYPLPAIAGVYNNVQTPARFVLKYYPGIKDMKLMKDLPESAFGVIHLAYWSWLEPICRPMLWMLNTLKDLTGSYGLAIILLTVIVKLVLWPLIHRGNKSMRKLQKLQPILKEMKEKYKDNQQLFSQKMAELYKKEKVNPLGGCLPMLLQIPIFIALYSTLDAAVELRHVPFLWATDLSRPDLVGPQFFFGCGIHPLIIISTLLTVLQMKLTPSTGDNSQQKIMMIMPVMMLFFFYNFPSGLALYWTVNNILSILQMKYSQYSAAKEEAAEAIPAKNA